MLKYVSKLFFSIAIWGQKALSLLIWGKKSLRAIDWEGAQVIIPF
jgi:hypothetical protein